MSPEELEDLAADIKANGLQHRVVVLNAQVLDGRNRLDALELTGWSVSVKPDGQVDWLDEFDAYDDEDIPDPYTYVVSASIHRRHLTTDQRKAIAAEILKRQPERSNGSVGAEVKLDKNTVGAVRKEGEARGEIHQAKPVSMPRVEGSRANELLQHFYEDEVADINLTEHFKFAVQDQDPQHKEEICDYCTGILEYTPQVKRCIKRVSDFLDEAEKSRTQIPFNSEGRNERNCRYCPVCGQSATNGREVPHAPGKPAGVDTRAP